MVRNWVQDNIGLEFMGFFDFVCFGLIEFDGLLGLGHGFFYPIITKFPRNVTNEFIVSDIFVVAVALLLFELSHKV